MNTERIIRVMCADDHHLIRDGITFALQGEPGLQLVAFAATGAEAVEAYRTHSPDVILMDIQMPGLSGIDALIEIRKESPKAKCIVLTTYEGDIQASRALKAGAMGYLLKTMIRKRLIDAIRTVHSGRKYLPIEIASMVADNLCMEELSARELDVLRSIAAGCSNKIIADRLKISENTVKGHIKSIVAKLDANDRAHAVFLAMQRGLLDRY